MDFAMSMLQGLLAADVALIAVLAGCVVQLVKTAHLRALAGGGVEQVEFEIPRVVLDTFEDDDVAPPVAAMTGLTMPLEQIPIVYLGPALPEIPKFDTAAGETMTATSVAAAVDAPRETMAWSDLPLANAADSVDKNRILTGIVPLPAVREMDLYADPIDGVPFEKGEAIVLCECGTAYRESTRVWLLEHADCTCVQCHRTLPETAHAFGEQTQLDLEVASEAAQVVVQ